MVFPVSDCSFIRVLVADNRLEQRTVVEKSLRALGYFRVCPVATVGELIQLSHYSPKVYDRFDLLIVNADLIQAAGLTIEKFCVNNSRFRHVLVYDNGPVQKEPHIFTTKPYQQVRLFGNLKFEEILGFLTLIDNDFIQNKLQTASIKVA